MGKRSIGRFDCGGPSARATSWTAPCLGSRSYWAKRRSSRDDKTEGELCAAIARRDHDAVEMGEMSLGEGDRVLVLREEMSREPGWVFATCGDDCGYVPRNYLVPEEAPLPYESESTATAISASAFYRM